MPFLRKCHDYYCCKMYLPPPRKYSKSPGRSAVIVVFEIVRIKLLSRADNNNRNEKTDLSYTASTSPIISGVTEKKSQA